MDTTIYWSIVWLSTIWQLYILQLLTEKAESDPSNLHEFLLCTPICNHVSCAKSQKLDLINQLLTKLTHSDRNCRKSAEILPMSYLIYYMQIIDIIFIYSGHFRSWIRTQMNH